MLRISSVRLHWLAGVPASGDLCAHGGLRVADDDVLLLDAVEEELALSTGALHLLRTLDLDHTPEQPIAEHLIPHCGHFMAIDDATGRVQNMGCNSGANWWVRRATALVELEFDNGRRWQVASAEWCRAVARFSDEIEAFFAASDTKTSEDDYDRRWYAAFREEWQLRRATAPCAV